MKKLTNGMPSTLGSYKKLTELVFGSDSPQAKFVNRKIAKSSKGENEEVLADEGQMLYLLMNIEK